MKKSAYALSALVAALFLVLGCHCTPQNGGTPPSTTNTAPRTASDTIQVVFTNAPPTNVVAALNGIGAQPDTAGLVWTVPHWNFRDQQQEAALEAALRAGATMRKPPQ